MHRAHVPLAKSEIYGRQKTYLQDSFKGSVWLFLVEMGAGASAAHELALSSTHPRIRGHDSTKTPSQVERQYAEMVSHLRNVGAIAVQPSATFC